MARNRTTGGSAKGQYSFAQIPNVQTQRSVFNRSSGLTTTFDAGFIVPIFVDEVLPGDTMTMRVNTFARLSTPIVPVMDNLYLDIHWFFVPNRLLWDDWQHFMGEKDNPDDDFTYVIPKVSIPLIGSTTGSIYDYMGIPIEADVDVNALPFRAYNLIIKEWFRDQSLVDSPAVPKGPGPDTYATYTLARRAKRHDYFTAALPFAQRGPVVDVPILGEAPVTGDISPTGPFRFANPAGTEIYDVDVINDGGIGHLISSNNDPSQNLWYTTGLELENGIANLDDVQAISVNALRQSVQLQRMFERDARGGVRYTEILQAHFRVTSPDARLQRPEFLGYASSRITFHPVAQTNSTNQTSPKGDLAAFATAAIDDRGFSQSFTEHGHILGLVSVRAEQTYQYGLERMWSRETKYDFYWPALAHLGEQEVLNKELYFDSSDGQNDDVFGYQERWAEYRYKPSKITGKMRSYVSAGNETIHYWHLAQEWNNRPLLNQQFIEENPPMDRILAVPTEPDIFLDAAFSYRSTRVMPTYSVPGLMDHF